MTNPQKILIVEDDPGNRLGLAIVKAIVESHSGRVEAQSRGIGEDSTFSVMLSVHLL